MILVLTESNYITAFESLAEAESYEGTERFSSIEELSELAGKWPASRLVEIWNNLPGVMAVKKFTDRKTAINRIWKALERMQPSDTPQNHEDAVEAANPELPVTETPAAVEPEPHSANELPELGTPAVAGHDANVTPQASEVAPEQQGAGEKKATEKREETGTPRWGSKSDVIRALLKREGGASLQEIMDATGCQKHSVRGFLAGTFDKKMNLNLTPAKDKAGERRCRIQPGAPALEKNDFLRRSTCILNLPTLPILLSHRLDTDVDTLKKDAAPMLPKRRRAWAPFGLRVDANRPLNE